MLFYSMNETVMVSEHPGVWSANPSPLSASDPSAVWENRNIVFRNMNYPQVSAGNIPLSLVYFMKPGQSPGTFSSLMRWLAAAARGRARVSEGGVSRGI